jgi:hypothetical protein
MNNKSEQRDQLFSELRGFTDTKPSLVQGIGLKGRHAPTPEIKHNLDLLLELKPVQSDQTNKELPPRRRILVTKLSRTYDRTPSSEEETPVDRSSQATGERWAHQPEQVEPQVVDMQQGLEQRQQQISMHPY